MVEQEILDQISRETAAIEASLIFWNEQARLQPEEPFRALISRHIHDLEMSLANLYAALEIVSDP